MSLPRPPKPAALLCGLILREGTDPSPFLVALEAAFGPISSSFGPWPFASPHYEAEMGGSLERRFALFAHPFDSGRLARAKLATNELESRFREGARRAVNLDPGAVTASKLVLASMKDNVARVYLGEGVYAECTLRHERGAWRPFEHTYRDFADGRYREALDAARILAKSFK